MLVSAAAPFRLAERALLGAGDMVHAELLIYMSVSLVLALVFGLITERLRLSPIVGYLLAGIALSFAFDRAGSNGEGGDQAKPEVVEQVEDAAAAAQDALKAAGAKGALAETDKEKVDEIAFQLAEVGVILLMFGVGLHFNLRDLWAVRKVALPGAVGQIAAATAFGWLACRLAGLNSTEGVIVGMAISVASTVVLIRVLMDNNVLETPQGHIAVGWLIVEDIFTVLALVALPALAEVVGTEGGGDQSLAKAIGGAAINITLLAAIVLGGGRFVIPRLMNAVARTRSRELFTLSVLAIALAIATGSAYFFGVSMALGAFLAGMVVGQTEVSHQAGADALPMRDAFAVLFFVSVGMLFDLQAVMDQPVLLVLLLVIVLLVKSFIALVIVWALRYSFRTALTVAIALAQIGEFSFLLADSAARLGLMSTQGRSLLVVCAIISITLNPLYFRAIPAIEAWCRTRPRLWKLLTSRSEVRGAELNKLAKDRLGDPDDSSAEKLKAVIVGYGPVGKTAARILRDFNIQPVVIDMNLDTVRDLAAIEELAVYGDATRREILEAASIADAKYLLVTVPDVLVRTLVILTARELNEDLRVFARARYLKERAWLEEVGATQICIEEAETAAGLAVLLLREVGADEDRVRAEIDKLHHEFGVQRPEIPASSSS